MNRDDAEEYTQSLGQIVAGSWRQIALARRLGVPKALGLTTEDWVADRLGGYIKMTVPDRREAVKELTAEGMSQREIGDVLGVDEKTVRRDAADAAPVPEKTRETAAPEEVTAANAAPDPAIALRDQELARQEQRWAATLNIIEAVETFERPLSRAVELAAEYDPIEAKKYRREQVTPARLRSVAAFVMALASAMEEIHEEAA